MVFKAVLFDMDDTLIDWSGWSGEWQQLEQRHLQQVYDLLVNAKRPLNTDFATFFGSYHNRLRDAWMAARTNLLAPHNGKILMETLAYFGFIEDDLLGMNECLAAYDWRGAPGVCVFPDVPPMLEKLQQRGIKLGIVTNASQPMQMRDPELETFGLLQYFPDELSRISAADVGYLKPHEAIFRHALNALGTTAEETVFIGDNPIADIAGAQSAGMKAVLRVTSPAPPLISGLIVPDAAINSMDELPTILDEFYPGWQNGTA